MTDRATASGAEPSSPEPSSPEPGKTGSADAEEKTHWGRLAPLFLTVLVDVFSMTLILPLLPHVAQRFGATPFVVGLLIASFSVCQLVSGPILGRLGDQLGRKPVLVASQAGTMTGLLIMALGARLEWLFIGRILDGITAGNLSTAQAVIADNTAPRDRTKAFGFFGIAFGLGFLLGPAISGALAHAAGYQAPFFAAAGLSLLSIALTASLLPYQPPAQKRNGAGMTRSTTFFGAVHRVLRDKKPRSRILELFTYVASFATLTGGLAMFLERRLAFNVEQVGYAFAFSGLVGGLVQGGIGRLANRLGEARLSFGGLVLMIGGYAVLANTQSVTTLGVALTLGGIGAAVVRPSLMTLLTSSVAEEDRGLLLGVSQSATSIGQALGPALAGALINAGALGAWAYAAAAIAAATLVIRALSG